MSNPMMDGFINEIMSKGEGIDNKEELIALLRRKSEELGPNASEEEVMGTIQSCLIPFIASGSPEEDDEDFEEEYEEEYEEEDEEMGDFDSDYMSETVRRVEEVFNDQGWKFSTVRKNPELTLFELGFTLEKCNLKMKVYIEDDPKVCRIDGILPINCDPLYSYPLCKFIAKANYPRRYGALQYDERDGEISYQYSFSTLHGLYKDDFKTAFFAVAHTAVDDFDIVKRFCVGRFKKSEKEEIMEILENLTEDLTSDEY